MPNTQILLCTDLDRTVLPNGPHPESPQARPLLRRLAAHPDVRLAYVSGRHRSLLKQAIADYDLPPPDYAIADVGTTIYEIDGRDWHTWDEWRREIAPDWNGMTHDDLMGLLADLRPLSLQEPAKQNIFKLSYYAPPETDADALLETVRKRLQDRQVHANLIWSMDEIRDLALLDVLPAGANKLHAIEFLIARKGYSPSNTVFAGDSGNDLAVLTSRVQAVLVANAADEVKDEALALSQAAGTQDRLYLATGEFLDMNGNYAAGVLEGLAHFLPETLDWMRAWRFSY